MNISCEGLGQSITSITLYSKCWQFSFKAEYFLKVLFPYMFEYSFSTEFW